MTRPARSVAGSVAGTVMTRCTAVTDGLEMGGSSADDDWVLAVLLPCLQSHVQSCTGYLLYVYRTECCGQTA